MRLICGVVGMIGAAVFAVAAHALDLPPLPVPPLPVPTLPTPTLPTLPAPTLPAPPVPVATTTPPPPAVTPAPQPQPETPPQSTTAPATTAAAAQPPSPTHAVPPRRATHARRAERAHTLGHFRLARAGRLVVTVRELAPVCRELGHYRLAARRGANTLKVPARITRPGSYVFVGRVHGRKIFTIETRIAAGRRVLARAPESVCSAPVVSDVSMLTTAAAAPQVHVEAASTQRVAPKLAASPLIRAVSLEDAPASIRPLLFAMLALAILLLTTAAVPQRVLPAGRSAAVIARQRVYLAAAGIGLLVAVALATALA